MPRPKNALIVDDEPHVRVFLRLLLRELGIAKVWEAADGAQALEMVGQHQPQLVLLDINLPVMTGLQVLEKLAAAQPGTPVVIVSSHNALKTVLECRKLGAFAYVLKHSPKDEALKALREALDTIEAESEELDGGAEGG